MKKIFELLQKRSEKLKLFYLIFEIEKYEFHFLLLLSHPFYEKSKVRQNEKINNITKIIKLNRILVTVLLL